MQEKRHKWLCSPNVDKVPTSPLPSWESPPLMAGTKIRNGYMAQMWPKGPHHPCRGNKNEKQLCSPNVENVAASPLPSQGSPTLMAGTKMRINYAAQMWTKWLHHPLRLRGPQRPWREQNENRLCSPNEEKVGTSPLPAQGSPTLMVGTKMRSNYAAQMWTKWLHHPLRLRGPQHPWRGQK